MTTCMHTEATKDYLQEEQSYTPVKHLQERTYRPAWDLVHISTSTKESQRLRVSPLCNIQQYVQKFAWRSPLTGSQPRTLKISLAEILTSCLDLCKLSSDDGILGHKDVPLCISCVTSGMPASREYVPSQSEQKPRSGVTIPLIEENHQAKN